MQEETMVMSDNEVSDEVVMVDPSQSSSSMPNQRLPKRDQTVIDNQLKAVGLYEEGLSAEQKEELLAVIAASEETAQKEESMRSKAREWQQKIFASDIDIHTSPASTVCQPLLQPAYVNVVTESEVQNSLQMLNIEGPTEPSAPSAETFQSPVKVLTKKAPEVCQDIQTCTSSENINAVQKAQKSFLRRGRPRRLRANCEISEGKAIQGSLVFHSPEDEGELINADDADFKKQKKDLEKCMSEWRPCTSPEPPPVSFKRIMQRDNMVPYKCAVEHCGQTLLSSVNRLHSAVSELQRSSPFFLQWGCPVTVGRAYATRSTRARGPDSENSDGAHIFHFPNISDQASATTSSSSECTLTEQFNASKNSALARQRLRAYDKTCDLEKCQMSLSTDSTSSMRTRSSNSIVNQMSPTSLNVINSKSAKANACEATPKGEAPHEDTPICEKLDKLAETKCSTQSCSSHLTKSESISLCKASVTENSEEHLNHSETEMLLNKQKKSLSETDVSATKDKPLLNSFDDTDSKEVIENCESPLIVVDDEPSEEQENVTCSSEKGACRKRVSAKVPVTSPSKRLKGNNS